MKVLLIRAIASVAFLLVASAVWAEITGSAHDFSSYGWSGQQICVACHIPHDADQTVPESPLWNHEVGNETYTLYSSPTLDQQPEQPRGPSLLCLGCHDGVTAVDSFGGNMGSYFLTGDARIGTDLSNDHPISIYWDHQTGDGGLVCSNCHNFHEPVDPYLPFFDRYVECSTCHDVHNTVGIPKLLRASMSGSQLCLHCHPQ
ncbi:MAG: cytochrome c3 family protein [Planctomycetota bacterium]